MKHFFISLIVLLQCTMLLGHGFSVDTLVLLANNGWQQIGTVCYCAQKKKISIASYDVTSLFQTIAQIIRGGRSKSNCYIRFGFEERFKDSQHYNELACTPTQEFYCARTHQWIPAYMLKVGDELVCANNTTKIIAYISLIDKPLEVYSIEVKPTHTFFVTTHSIITHNMVLPIAFSAGLSIPFGASAGGAAGSFFGPVTFVIGAAIGCIVGTLVKIVCDGKIPTYTIDTYDVNTFKRSVNQQPENTMSGEPSIIIGPHYMPAQQIVMVSTHNEHTFNDDDQNEVSFSITIQNPAKEKPGCGDATPQTPPILITPADPIPVRQCPGYSLPLEEDKQAHHNGGCGAIPDELKDVLNKPIIHTTENNAEDKVDTTLDGASYEGKSNEGTKIYSKPNDYEDAIKDFEGMELGDIRAIKNGEGFVGSLPDGRQVNVRKTSKGDYKGENKWPTLEIRSVDGRRSKIKIRYTKGKS